MTITIGDLFQIIDEAKSLKAYAIANVAWYKLLDLSLDKSAKQIQFWYEDAGDEESDYYDLAVISDGLREACIPIPLLKPNIVKAFKSMSQKIERREHYRQYDEISFEIEEGKIKDYIEKIEGCLNQKKAKLKKLSEKLEEIPDIRNLIEKYLNISDWDIPPVRLECKVCHYFANRKDINCAIHPKCYPLGQCPDWQINSDSPIINYFEENLKYHIEEEKRKKEREKEYKEGWIKGDEVWCCNTFLSLEKYEGEIFWLSVNHEDYRIPYPSSEDWKIHELLLQNPPIPFKKGMGSNYRPDEIYYPLLKIDNEYFLVRWGWTTVSVQSRFKCYQYPMPRYMYESHRGVQNLYRKCTDDGKKAVYFPSRQQWRRVEE